MPPRPRARPWSATRPIRGPCSPWRASSRPTAPPASWTLLERSLKVNPALAEARVFLAELRLDQEDYEAAAREAERVARRGRVLAARPLRAGGGAAPAGRHRAVRSGARARARPRTRATPSSTTAWPRSARATASTGRRSPSPSRRWRSTRGRGGDTASSASTSSAWAPSRTAARASRPPSRAIPTTSGSRTRSISSTPSPSTRRRRPHTSRILLHEKESELLSPFAAALAEEAYARLTERYGYRPDGPVRIEVYPDHADFSVRTVGLAGLGRARRLLRPRARHRLAVRARGRPVQLGLDAVARAGPHRHPRARRETASRAGSRRASPCTRSIARGPAGATT